MIVCTWAERIFKRPPNDLLLPLDLDYNLKQHRRMKRFLLALCIVLTATSFLHAQRKSDLIAEIEALKTELDSTKMVAVVAQKNEKIGLTRAESFEKQVTELQDANSTLLRNLNNFAKVTNTNSANLNRVLVKLEEKENQLRAINDAFTSNDSTAVVVLTNVKRSLGENSRVGVSEGVVLVSSSLESLFGTTTSIIVTESGQAWLEKIAHILKANPKVALTIEGLSMTGEIELAADQATVIGEMLQNQFEIDPNRIDFLGKDGNFKEGINLKIHPNYTQFYTLVKENMKATN